MSKKDKRENVEINSDAPVSLDDTARVKVLSPSMLVFKRFMRNKLAIVGIIILLVMFAFSFLGGIISPYSQGQVFLHEEETLREYASATYNTEMLYTIKEGMVFPIAAQAQFILAVKKGQTYYQLGEDDYYIVPEGENFYRVVELDPFAEVMAVRGLYSYTVTDASIPLSNAVMAGFEAAVEANEMVFIADGVQYFIIRSGKTYEIALAKDIALASPMAYDAYNASDDAFIRSYEFHHQVEKAFAEDKHMFELDGERYMIEETDGNVIVMKNNENFAAFSNIIVRGVGVDTFLSVDFKNAVRSAVAEGMVYFMYAAEGEEEVRYDVNRVNFTYNIRRQEVSTLLLTYAPPSAEHPLGTDANGMDLMTRLMYGGRVSLMVGFAVVLIELVIGVIIGGIAGYFGGWVDTMLMRFVDLFNCIPYWPMLIIVGNILDANKVPPNIRIYLLMLVLGVLSWTGIARVVRGQILTLREQDFMVATEATGIRVRKRIFKHLVPNVMPLLIVSATMDLGSIIIAEATLSFLGLGVKYPMASWGSIINAATNVYVMTNFWYVWVPAGLLILLTVLGFNFVGDGLRDAFDPKMKR